MAIGPSGGPGDHVQERVEVEHSNVCALAPNQHLLLAGKTALETVVKQDHVKHDYVQVHILLIGFIFILNLGGISSVGRARDYGAGIVASLGQTSNQGLKITEKYLAIGETFPWLGAHYGKNDYILRITNSVSQSIHNEFKFKKVK